MNVPKTPGNIKPKVSIVSISYNHEKFIERALDSFLNQECNFDYEIIIADDNSSDRTQKIIQKYTRKHPEIIKSILRNKNIGVQSNLKDALVHAGGEYIALCEGDDYWIDVKKLQKQVDFLDEYKDYALCFHEVEVRDNKGLRQSIYPGKRPRLTIGGLLKNNYIQTNSVVYRRQDYNNLPTDFLPYDWYLHLYSAQFGKIGYINKVMSVYQLHESSLWSSYRGNQVKFWSRFGYEHLIFFYRVLEIYRDDKRYREIIHENIYLTMNNILEFANNCSNVVERLCMQEPDCVSVIINEQFRNLRELKNEIKKRDDYVVELHNIIDNKELEIRNIKLSRLWKLRNVLVRFMIARKEQ